MTENSKTISLIVAAAAVLLLALFTRPAPVATSVDKVVGQSLFPDLDDPLKAKRMRIVTYDELAGRAREFEVAQAKGVWSLPSHKNYPADAKEQMASAAASLVDLKVLDQVTNDRTKHELYGVVEPKPAEEQIGVKGFGKLVVIEDENGKGLAQLIIGKEDKPTKSDDLVGSQTQLRFVRKRGQDQVYRVAMKADKFSTSFADWIETDLLKLNPWEIAEIKLRDYSVVEGITASGELGRALSPKADIDLAFDDKTSKWTVKSLKEYKNKKKEEVKLADDEEPNLTKLNDLKSSLQGLKIIDVARKPAQLSADLKADKETMNDEGMADLIHRGFLPAKINGQFELVSNDGEAIVNMKDGVQYVLRFGEVAGIDTASEDEKKSDKGEKTADTPADGKTENSGEKKDKSNGLSRYIMVMAQFNPDEIPKPDLKPLPELKKAPDKKSADTKGDSKPADSKAAATKSTDSKGADSKAADKGAAPATTKGDAAKPEDKSTAAKSNATTEDDQEAIEAERDKIEKENHRKQEEYDEKIKKGQQRAKELNARFADWYYVVGGDTYKKIHLGKDDVITKKAKDSKETAATSMPKDPFQSPGAGKN